MNPGNENKRVQQALRAVLTPFNVFYGAATTLRTSSYQRNLIKQTRLGVPVISIGNITCGGTGKTPMTIEIGKTLLAAGLKVGILSRGYKRQSTEPVVIVSDGCGKFASVEEAGDEPLLIAHNLPEAVVIVGRDRRATGSLAASSFFGCQIILLDDGMQHLPLYRDADIVLLDYNDDLSINSLLPAGRLREPLSSLRRASTIVVTKVPAAVDEDKLEKLLATVKHYAPEAAVNLSRLVPSQLTFLTGDERPLSRLKNARIAVFCGLAKPENFSETLVGCGAQIVKEFRYADHYWYSESDIYSLNKVAASVDLIVTTEKDLVRLQSDNAASALAGKGARNLAKKLCALEVTVEWIDGMPSLLDRFVKTAASGLHEVLRK